MKEYQERLIKAFGSRFHCFFEIEKGKFQLLLKGIVFTSLDYNNIIQIGWNYHIGFVSVSFIDLDEYSLIVELRAY